MHKAKYVENKSRVRCICLHFQRVLLCCGSYGEFLSFRCNRSGLAFVTHGQTPSLRPGVLNGVVQAPCTRTCHSFSEHGGFKNPHTSDHSPGTPPGHQNGVATGGTGKSVLAKASSKMLMGGGSLPDWRRQGAVEVARSQVHVLLQHYSTDCLPLGSLQAKV